MLSLLVTLLASAPLPAAPSASITCADGPASCDSAWVVMGAPAADRDEPRDYATPAEVECPTPAGDADLGECADEGPFDLWYRMSRFAQPDPGGVGSAPARRSAAAKITGSSYGAPHDVSPRTGPDAPQLALFALPALPPTGGTPDFSPDARGPTARPIAPPERPPRA